MTATRFLPKHFSVGQPFPVIIKVESSSGKPFSFTMHETLPDNSQPAKGKPPFIFKNIDNTIKWICNSKTSPYFLAYLVMASSDSTPSGKLNFTGFIKVDNSPDNAKPVQGSTSVTISNYHWADSNSDGRIDDAEILAIYNSFDVLSGLGADLDLIKQIWSGKGYSINPETNRYTVIK